MIGRDDDSKPPFDDGDDWIDRDDDAATGPLVDRDDDELFGAEPPPREPGFPEEREYPEVPDWQDEDSDPDSAWDAPSADNDAADDEDEEDLNQLAARELGEFSDDPYPPEPDDPLPPMDTGSGARAAPPPPISRGAMDRDAVDSNDDSWSDDSAETYPHAGYASSAQGIPDQGIQSDDATGTTGARRWPIAMLIIAAVAVLLLAVGGYGVISERSALEGEIRQLQAELATTISPDEARASRDAQEAAVRANAALEEELRILRAENAELQQAVRDMEARVASRIEEAEKAVAEAQQAAAAAERRSSANTSTASPGDWFVNFGSYAQVSDAKRWAARLGVDSGRVVVQDARSNGETIHRVRVVSLPDKATADRVARQLESEHKLPKLWVGKN